MNVSADLPRRLPPESMAQLCHVVADVKLKKQKKKRERKKKEEREKSEKGMEGYPDIYIYICQASNSFEISIFPDSRNLFIFCVRKLIF